MGGEGELPGDGLDVVEELAALANLRTGSTSCQGGKLDTKIYTNPTSILTSHFRKQKIRNVSWLESCVCESAHPNDGNPDYGDADQHQDEEAAHQQQLRLAGPASIGASTQGITWLLAPQAGVDVHCEDGRGGVEDGGEGGHEGGEHHGHHGPSHPGLVKE